MKVTLKILLATAVMPPVYMCYKSVTGPIGYDDQKTIRDSAIIARLIEIRRAQIKYKNTYKTYAGSFDDLKELLNTDRLLFLTREGVPTDGQLGKGMTETEAVKRGLIRRDTMWVSTEDTLPGKSYDVAAIRYIPAVPGEKTTFKMDTATLESGSGYEIKVSAYEVPYKGYLRDMDARSTYNLIDKTEKQGRFPRLRIGFLEEVNSNVGSWEQLATHMTINVPDTLTIGNSEKYIAPIRFQSGGLPFSEYNPSAGGSFFYRETEFDRAVPFISSLKEFFFAHEFLTWTYKRVNMICVSPEYSLVPDNYWGDGKEGHPLDFCFFTLELRRLTGILKKQQAKSVFDVGEEVYEFCSRSLSYPSFFRYMISPLMLWTKESDASLPRQMYVMTGREWMDVVCYAQGKLLFISSYPIDQSDDIVYYILYVRKQAGLDREKNQLLLAGESSSRMRILERLRTHLCHAKPAGIPSEACLLGTDVTKALMGLISLLIHEQ